MKQINIFVSKDLLTAGARQNLVFDGNDRKFYNIISVQGTLLDSKSYLKTLKS